MSRTARDDRHHAGHRRTRGVLPKHAKPHTEKSMPPVERKNYKPLIACIVIAILAIIPFSLGKYFEFNSPDAFDGGAYVYSAKHILDGAEIGVEEKPSAKLGTLTVNMLGVWLFGFRDIGPEIVQTVFQLAALVLMFVAMTKLFGKLSAGVGVIVASIYLSAPFIAKYGNVKEQFMIACMIMGISSLVIRQLGGRWWWALLAGGFVSWAPLFKETGMTAIGAIGLFVIAQPIFKHRPWKQTGIDILLLFAGAIAAISPFYIWILGWNVQMALPYEFIWRIFVPAEAGAGTLGGSYISGARQLRPFSQQWPIVLRFYGLLILPIALALGSIVMRIIRIIFAFKSKEKVSAKPYDRYVLLFAVWWLLDMAFIWISPRSYEQYYLPLNASAAMLGGYLIAIYSDKFNSSVFKMKWGVVGAAGLAVMIMMSWHVFFGIKTSPHYGGLYTNQRTNLPEKRNGYSQRYREISLQRRQAVEYPWEMVGEYIRDNSDPNDKIFVWGWYPGIYVSAQRLAPTSWPFTSEMHTKTPKRFAGDINGLLAELQKNPPKYIVDSRKTHFPGNRPPLELWPVTGNGLLDKDERLVKQFEAEYGKMLRDKFDDAEAGRFEAMKPFRDFVMNRYQPVRAFGPHILFEQKSSTSG